MSAGAKHHLKSDLTSEVTAFQLTGNNWAIVSKEQLCYAAWCPASSGVHTPSPLPASNTHYYSADTKQVMHAKATAPVLHLF